MATRLFSRTTLPAIIIRRRHVWSKENVVSSPCPEIVIPKVNVNEFIWQNLDKWPTKIAMDQVAKVSNMASPCYKYPEWIKPNDPFFAMVPKKCLDKMIWLIRTLPSTAPTNLDGEPISILEFFLQMDEEDFLVAIEYCPRCTNNVLASARDRHLERKTNRLANMPIQDETLEIGLLFNSNLS